MVDVNLERKAMMKRIDEITAELDALLVEVTAVTGWEKLTVNAKIGGKNSTFIDIRSEVILSHEQYIAMWLNGLMKYLDNSANKENSNIYELLKYMQNYDCVKKYAFLFLERLYLRHYDEVSKVRPTKEQSEIWIGQNNANYGLLVSPRFKNGQWENDGSEVRKFKPKYYTIGHILETGFVIPGENERIPFGSVDDYLRFFKNVIVRNSGSEYEMEIAKMYVEYVKEQDKPEDVPLLIPEYRYKGIDKNHKYRLDFTVINPYTMEKYGFELSPWSTHGYISGTKSKSQAEINDEALRNFEKEMAKHKAYYKEHGVYCFIYTDSDLKNIQEVFEDIKKYLKPKRAVKQLMVQAMDKFERYK